MLQELIHGSDDPLVLGEAAMVLFHVIGGHVFQYP
jgi:hypothetical protein